MHSGPPHSGPPPHSGGPPSSGPPNNDPYGRGSSNSGGGNSGFPGSSSGGGGGSSSDHYSSHHHRDRDPPPTSQINEPEFDEILQRNKTVSSSAISRAVQDASAGEYASAIETLVTAISLIKQSKIANDDRCKILISSLQDTLHGIESKSYGSK